MIDTNTVRLLLSHNQLNLPHDVRSAFESTVGELDELRARLEAAEQVIASVSRWVEARDLCTPMTAREAQDRRYDAGVALLAAHSNYFARYGDKKSDV